MPESQNTTQILIVGGGTGGVAAALGAAALGASVVVTEETDWIGGQLTSQAVPPDENPWIETTGCTRRYRALRDGIRQWYRDHRSLTESARKDPHLNPGGGGVSKICHEPRVSLAVLEAMLAPFVAKGLVKVLHRHKPIRADVEGDRVRSVTLRDLSTGGDVTIAADYVLDGTELGDLLPMAGREYVFGAESQNQTQEPHAVSGDPQSENVQSFTWCFPVAWDSAPQASHVIDKPRQYERWRNYVPHLTPPWPGRLLAWQYPQPSSLKPVSAVLFPQEAKDHPRVMWNYRKIVRSDIYEGKRPDEVTLVNWPQNDYWEHNIIDKPAEDVAVWLEEAKQLSLSLLYWMQTEAPHPDGSVGYPGLYLVPEMAGTKDGLAMAPYIRESRRIKAVFTVTENHVGAFARYGHEKVQLTGPDAMKAKRFPDSVGIGYYRIDLHPSTGGKNYIDIASLPFQIPLGALIPVRMRNLLPACKNLGVTHITNGCYRLHPVEWNIGESAGMLAAFCVQKKVEPRHVREKPELLSEFQKVLTDQGVELEWKL
jgi:hypothetical protein